MAGESEFEKNCVDIAEADGWYAIKIMRTEKRGRPDRLFIKHGLHVWVEFKNEGKSAGPQQQIRHKELREAGAFVYVIEAPDYSSFRAALGIRHAR